MNERVYVAGITPFGKRLAAGVASLTQPDLLMKGGCKNPEPPRRWPTAHAVAFVGCTGPDAPPAASASQLDCCPSSSRQEEERRRLRSAAFARLAFFGAVERRGRAETRCRL